MEEMDVISDEIESVYDEIERYIELHHTFTLQDDVEMKRLYDKIDKLRDEYYRLLLEDEKDRNCG